MTPAYSRAAEIVLVAEGKLSINPKDDGGTTKYGITLVALREWFLLTGRGREPTEADIRALTVEDALDIYWRQYWLRCACDDLPWLLALPVFDCAVNQGQGTAKKLLQRALGVKDDGIIGVVTLRAARAATKETLDLFMALRAKRYAEDDEEDVQEFGKGWFRRLFKIARLAQA